MEGMKNTHQFGLMVCIMLCSLSLLVVQGAATAKNRNESHDGPLQIVWFSSTPDFITEGKRIDLECYFSGWPFPQEVHWFKDGKIITNGAKGIYHSEDRRRKNGKETLHSRLTLPSGREELEGIYNCSAKNKISEVSEYLQLIYVCPRPQSPTMVATKDPASKSSNVNLACLIDYGWACPQRLFWNLNNNSEPLPESGEKYKIQVKDTQSKCNKEFILSIFNVTEHDEGTYSCHWRCRNSDLKAAIDLKVSDEPETGA